MKMLGRTWRSCPYGKGCSCNPPKKREAAKKWAKRREQREWRKEARGYTEPTGADQEDR